MSAAAGRSKQAIASPGSPHSNGSASAATIAAAAGRAKPGEPRQQHRVARAVVDEQHPRRLGRDPGAHRAQSGEQGGIALGGERGDQVVVGAARLDQRLGQVERAHFDPAAFVMAVEQALGGLGERFVDRDRRAADARCASPPRRGGPGSCASSRGNVVEFEPEPAEAVAAAPARHRQRHRRAGDRAVVVADQPLDRAAVAGARAIAAGGG